MDDDSIMLFVCAGPPKCDLSGDDAVEAQMIGCIWCSRITLYADGTETETRPGSA